MKLLSSPAIQFKGSGWYITDYARKDSGKDSRQGLRQDSAERRKDSDAARATERRKSSSSGKTDSTQTERHARQDGHVRPIPRARLDQRRSAIEVTPRLRTFASFSSAVR